MKNNGSKSSDMLKGLRDRSPPAVDSSQKPPSGSVNSEATRSETAPNCEPQGPRVA